MTVRRHNGKNRVNGVDGRGAADGQIILKNVIGPQRIPSARQDAAFRILRKP